MAGKKHSWIVLASFLLCFFVVSGVVTAQAKEAVSTEEQVRVNLNKASLEELQAVRGIGPVLGQRIVDYRQTNGPFKNLDDLALVSGIGKVKYEKMKDQLVL